MEHRFNFETALGLVKSGKRISRLGWNGKGMWIEKRATEGLRPFLTIRGTDGLFATWVPSITDLFADDWEAHDPA